MAKKRTSRRGRDPVNFWNSFLFMFTTKVLLGLAVVTVFLTLTQCTIKKPESPTWNTSFVVPVVNRTYHMDEIIRKIDQDEISIDSTGEIAFSISEELDTVRLDDGDLSTSDLSETISETLGRVDIKPPTMPPCTLDLSSLASDVAVGIPGTDSILIPPDTSVTANNDFTTDSYSWAEVSSGGINITITNHLGFDLDSVAVRLIRDSQTPGLADTIATGVFPTPIHDDSTKSLLMPLDGKRLVSFLRVSVYCHTDDGGRIDPIGKQIVTHVSFPDGLEVSSAEAEVPALDDILFSQKICLDLDPGERIDTARLESGFLTLDLANGTTLDAGLSISIPSLELNGIPFAVVRQVAAGQSALLDTNLVGYDLIPTNDSVSINVTVSVPGSNGLQVIVEESDSFSVDATIGSLSFSSVTGVLAGKTADFSDIHEDLDVPDGFDEITLLTAVLTLEVENGVDLPGYLDIRLDGSNGKSLLLSGDIAPRGTQQTQLTTITNDSVADFLSPLPEAIDVAGSVQFGDGDYQGTITKDDFIFARVKIYAPLEVKISNSEISDIDIEKEEIDQEDIDIITDHVVEARFVYDITNHLPLGVSAIVHLGGDSASLFSSPQLTLDTLYVEPAPVSLITGIAIADTTSSGEIFLDSLDLKVLENDTLFIRQQLFLSGSDSAGVKLTQQDYITISGRIEVIYRFDGEF